MNRIEIMYPNLNIGDKAVLNYMQEDLKLNEDVIIVIYDMMLALNRRITPVFTKKIADEWKHEKIESIEDVHKLAIDKIKSTIAYRRRNARYTRYRIDSLLDEKEKKLLMLASLRSFILCTIIPDILNISVEKSEMMIHRLVTLKMLKCDMRVPTRERTIIISNEYRNTFKTYDAEYEEKVIKKLKTNLIYSGLI